MATVLIVDDSKTSRKILRGILEGAGHVIVGEGVNGEEAFLRYKELRPDIVTLDITMPKMDGLEALQILKKQDENARIIMITALGQKEKMIQAVKFGATEFITKPFEDEDVLKAVNKALEN
ncbi:MAG: response regulator [Alistipes sp.]|nr:response regulator [Alistipes sp.]